MSEFFKPKVASEIETPEGDIAKFHIEDYVSAMSEAMIERDSSRSTANQQWTTIFTRKDPPLCDVHGLPCVELVTKKPGPNLGRGFWICSKPVGPGYDNGKSKLL
jgi:AP endonuclease-2